jgi:hypothetical protein
MLDLLRIMGSGLVSKPIEFDGIKIRVIKSLPCHCREPINPQQHYNHKNTYRHSRSNHTMGTNEFWDLIDTIARDQPFRKDKLERLLDVRLVRESANAYFVMYSMERRGRSPHPVRITAIDLRVKTGDPDHPGFLHLEIAGPQVDISELTRRYPEGSVTPPPPGNLSGDPEYTYAKKEPWGTLMFGVSSGTSIVKSISFHPGE